MWANQRGFSCGSGTDGENNEASGRMSVRGFESMGVWWVGILSLVVFGEENTGKSVGLGLGKRKALGRGLSSYQMFKAALDFLGEFMKLFRVCIKDVLPVNSCIQRSLSLRRRQYL